MKHTRPAPLPPPGVWLCALLLAVTPAARAADVLLYGLIKERSHEQTNATPVPAAEPYSFYAFVIATNPGAVSGATVRPGSGATTPLVPEPQTGHQYLLQRFASEPALNAVFPNVNYTLAIQAAQDGPRSLTLNLTSGLYPNAPRVANFAAAQAVNATNPFTLQWDAFTGGTTNDLIQLVITDTASNVVFTSPTLGQSNRLDGLDLSALVPAGTLQPGRAYTGNLLFAKIFLTVQNQLVYPGVPGAAAFAARTLFPLRASAAPAMRRPTLRVVAATLGGVTLAFDAEPGVDYRLVAATNPAAPEWTTVFATNAAGSNVLFTAPSGGPPGERFFRVESP